MASYVNKSKLTNKQTDRRIITISVNQTNAKAILDKVLSTDSRDWACNNIDTIKESIGKGMTRIQGIQSTYFNV
jgi:hypothetical protein